MHREPRQRLLLLRVFFRAAPDWVAASLVGLTVFLGYTVTAWYGTRQNTDTSATLLSAWQLAQHGTLDLSTWNGEIPWRVDTDQGVYTNRFPGAVLAGVPFYWLLGDAAAPSTFPAGVAAAFWTAVAVTFCYLLLRRLLTGTRAAAAGTAVFALATPTWSVSADSLWTHGPSQALLLIGLWLVTKDAYLWAGLPLGLTILCRPHLAVAVASIGLILAVMHRRTSIVLKLGCFPLLAATGLVLYNREIFGTWSVLGGYNGDHLRATGVGPAVFIVNVLGALISPSRGILLLTPFLLLLVPGLKSGWRASPSWARAAGLGGLAYALVQLYLLRFNGGAGFYSYRTMIEPMTLAVPLLAVTYREWTGVNAYRRAWFWALVTLSVGFYSFGAMMDPHQPELGNPFRTFSGWSVAQDIHPAWSIAWLAVTVAATGLTLWRLWPHSSTSASAAVENPGEGGSNGGPLPARLDEVSAGGPETVR